jgi:hypothetical protein
MAVGFPMPAGHVGPTPNHMTYPCVEVQTYLV